MMAHTPGPWIKKFASQNRTEIRTNGEKSVGLIWTTYAEGVDNATLISAAPDLLEACKAALERSNQPDQPAFDSLRGILRDAIAKAEGR